MNDDNEPVDSLAAMYLWNRLTIRERLAIIESPGFSRGGFLSRTGIDVSTVKIYGDLRSAVMTTPVFINVFNRLTTTRTLADQVAKLDGARPVIIDNDSTWEPLLEWYEDCPYDVIRLKENFGHHAPWLCGAISNDNSPFYVVTDCDLDIDGVPLDALERLREPFDWDQRPAKSGLGLRIDDLPPWQNVVLEWESRWWFKPVSPRRRFFWAAIDTTFAMYSRETPHAQAMTVIGVPSVRSADPYVARHVPWYLDGENLDAENANYFATANRSNSWKPKGKSLVAPYA